MSLIIQTVSDPTNEHKIYDCDADDWPESFIIKILDEKDNSYWYAKIDGPKADAVACFGSTAILIIVEYALNILDVKSKSLKHYFPKEHEIIDMMNVSGNDDLIIFLTYESVFISSFNKEHFKLNYPPETKFDWNQADEDGFHENVSFKKIIHCYSDRVLCSILYENHELICEFTLNDLTWINKNDIQQKINMIKTEI